MATELFNLNPEGTSIEDIYEQSCQEETDNDIEEERQVVADLRAEGYVIEGIIYESVCEDWYKKMVLEDDVDEDTDWPDQAEVVLDPDRTDVISWPWVQELFELPGFRENSALLTSQPYYDEYGDSAYAVKVGWLDTLDPEIILKFVDGIEGEGPSFNEAILQDNIFLI